MIESKIKKMLSYFPPEIQEPIITKSRPFRSELKSSRRLLSYYFLWFKLRTIKSFKWKKSKETNQSLGFNEAESVKKRKKQEIIIDDPIKLQSKIDSLSYPPTHEYNVKELKPKGVLKYRFTLMKTLAPNFFEGNNFLDIGCNKGFFSLLASQNFIQVHSIDPDKKYTDLCQLLAQPNMKVECTNFRNFVPEKEFDKIMLGNVHHYIFRECGGWEWIYKLAAISRGEVLIEGPVDMNCKDMETAIPQNLQEFFTFENFLKVMNRFFNLEYKTKSNLQGRYIMLFKRKPDEFDKPYKFFELPVSKVLKDTKRSIIFLTERNGKKMVAKVIKNPKDDLRIQINIARLSPISNGAIGSIYHRNRFIGWLEEFRNDEIYSYKENQIALLKLLCEHNIFLAKLGFLDRDCATINFFKKDSKMFDKDTVKPIITINETHFDKIPGYEKGSYFVHLDYSFDIINEKMQKQIYNALKSKDSTIIETTFTNIKKALEEIQPLKLQ